MCNERLRDADYTARGLIARANVECLCTSDRLPDDLQAHARLAKSGFATRVLAVVASGRGRDVRPLVDRRAAGLLPADGLPAGRPRGHRL